MPRRIHRRLSVLFVVILVASVLLPMRQPAAAAAPLPALPISAQSEPPAMAIPTNPQSTLLAHEDQTAFIPAPLQAQPMEAPSAAPSATPPSSAPALEFVLEGQTSFGERMDFAATTPYGHQIDSL